MSDIKRVPTWLNLSTLSLRRRLLRTREGAGVLVWIFSLMVGWPSPVFVPPRQMSTHAE
jgi:hypothetical protein